MGRNRSTLLAILAIASLTAAAPCRAAAISAEGRHGRVTVQTGTEDGDCYQDGPRLVCTDGVRIAVANLDRGCVRAEGGAICETKLGRERDPMVRLDATETEITCGTGAMKGTTFLLTDNDGKGSCDRSYDAYGKVNGGSCTKNHEMCATFDCEMGCGAASLNCGCRILGRRGNVTASN